MAPLLGQFVGGLADDSCVQSLYVVGRELEGTDEWLDAACYDKTLLSCVDIYLDSMDKARMVS